MDRQELLANLEAGRKRLETALARIDPMRVTEPGVHDAWSVKDLLAHLGWWEQHVVDIYDALLHNRSSDPALAETPIDELNRQALAENAARSWAEVQNNEKNSYHALMMLAETAPEADLFDPHRFAETEGRPFVDWILSNSCGHYDEHLPALLAWLDQTNASR